MVENRASKFFAKGVANIRINLVKAKKIGYDHGIRLMVTKIFSVILGIRERHLSRPTFLSSFQIKQPCGGTKTRQAPRLTSPRSGLENLTMLQRGANLTTRSRKF